MPLTPTVQTGREPLGKHYYFRYPQGQLGIFRRHGQGIWAALRLAGGRRSGWSPRPACTAPVGVTPGWCRCTRLVVRILAPAWSMELIRRRSRCRNRSRQPWLLSRPGANRTSVSVGTRMSIQDLLLDLLVVDPTTWYNHTGVGKGGNGTPPSAAWWASTCAWRGRRADRVAGVGVGRAVGPAHAGARYAPGGLARSIWLTRTSRQQQQPHSPAGRRERRRGRRATAFCKRIT